MRLLKIDYFGKVDETFETALKNLLNKFGLEFCISNYDHLDNKKSIIFEKTKEEK